MFVEAVFPFTDLRTFYLDRGGRAHRPQWPIPRVKEPNRSADFVRGMGAVARRPRGGVTGMVGEDILCDATGAVVFTEGMSAHLQIRFRRFFYDGVMSARLSVGVTAEVPKLGQRPVDSAIHHVMSLPIRVGPARLGFLRRELIFAGPDLSRYVQYRTSKHIPREHRIDKSTIGEGKTKPLNVHPEAPIMLFEATCRELTHQPWERLAPEVYKDLLTSSTPIVSLASFRDVRLPPELADVLAWTATAKDGGQVRCFMLVSKDGSPTARSPTPSIRALRIHLLRLIMERQNIRRLFEWLDTLDRTGENHGLDEQAVERAFTEADRRLRRLEKRNHFTSQIAEHLAANYVDKINPGESDSLYAFVDHTFSRRTVRKKARDFLEVDQDQRGVPQFYINDFRGAHITAGAVGSNAKAADTHITVVPQAISVASPSLMERAKLVEARDNRSSAMPDQQFGIAPESAEKAKLVNFKLATIRFVRRLLFG
jgi:hypothetical protein